MLETIDRKILSCAVLGFFIFAYTAQAIYACKCEARSLNNYYRSADSIVTAKILSFSPGNENPSMAVVEISEAWKRETPQQVKVLTEGSCSYNFVVGTENLLYLRLTPAGEFSTMQCQGNLPYAKSGRSLRWLKRYGKKGTILFADLFRQERDEIGVGSLFEFSSLDHWVLPID